MGVSHANFQEMDNIINILCEGINYHMEATKADIQSWVDSHPTPMALRYIMFGIPTCPNLINFAENHRSLWRTGWASVFNGEKKITVNTEDVAKAVGMTTEEYLNINKKNNYER